HGPGGERAVPLEPEVVVQPPRVVALDDEDRLLRPPRLSGEGLGRLLRIPLAPVLLQAHLGKLCLWARLGIGEALRIWVVSGQASPMRLFRKRGVRRSRPVYRPRVVFGAGEKTVDTGERRPGKRFLKRKRRATGSAHAD